MLSASCSPPQQTWPKKGLAAVILLASAALLLQGCATLSEDECLAADWWIIGHKDGSEGEPFALLAEHHEACAEHGIKPDRTAYAEGRQSGLQTYCSRFNGYRVGRNNSRYRGVCTGPLKESFLAGFRRGKEVREMEMAVWAIKQDRRKLRKKIRKLEEKLEAQRARFESDESSPDDREDAWARIGEFEYELEKLDLEYEESGTRQADVLLRLEEATGRARNDGYSDDGGYLQTYRDLKDLGDAFD